MTYPSREAGGVVWGYMGERAQPHAAFSEFLWTRLPPEQRKAMRIREEFNYLQAIEGGIDPAHLAYLNFSFREKPGPIFTSSRPTTACCSAIRQVDEEQHIRNTPFVFPGIRTCRS